VLNSGFTNGVKESEKHARADETENHTNDCGSFGFILAEQASYA
jgi:hypothetical protein